MRSKRAQKRKNKLPSPPKEHQGLPDPFSTLNPELVEQEILEADMCPCCADRLAEIALNKKEAAYLAWMSEGKEK